MSGPVLGIKVLTKDANAYFYSFATKEDGEQKWKANIHFVWNSRVWGTIGARWGYTPAEATQPYDNYVRRLAEVYNYDNRKTEDDLDWWARYAEA